MSERERERGIVTYIRILQVFCHGGYWRLEGVFEGVRRGRERHNPFWLTSRTYVVTRGHIVLCGRRGVLQETLTG